MIYVMSDIHGMADKYYSMMDKLNLTSLDTLYVLGDTVDRGTSGLEILLDMMKYPNLVHLCGNHDYAARAVLEQYTKRERGMPNLFESDAKFNLSFQVWLEDDGAATLAEYKTLNLLKRNLVIQYLRKFEPCKMVHPEGSETFYILAHTVPERDEMVMPDGSVQCSEELFMWGEPDYEEQYFDEIYIVTGHTPTKLIDSKSEGRIWQGNHHIAIDCGAVWGGNGRLGALCLDTMEEFYV